MNIFLGDRITLVRRETWVTGPVAGIVLDEARQVERVYIHGIESPFVMADLWRFVDDSEDSEEWVKMEEDEDDN